MHALPTHTNIKNVAKTSIPLMLSALSGYLMYFIDRLLLANFDLGAMNAVSATNVMISIFTVAALSTASIAETFVGRYHGAKKDHLIGKPVWHMIYFSLGCTLLFVPIAHFGLPYWIPHDLLKDGLAFGQIIFDFGAFVPLFSTLSAFFVGRGETRIVFYASLLGNILNLGLDMLLIFGYGQHIPAMGAKGAAIGTVIAQITQCLILAGFFLQKKHRDRYQTHKPSWDWNHFIELLQKGYPPALSHMFEIAAWAMCFQIAARASQMHITILAMGQNFFVLTVCLTEGLSRGTSTIAANCMGAKKYERIPSLLKSAFGMQALVVLIGAIPIVFLSDYWVQAFHLSNTQLDPKTLMHHINLTRYVILAYLAIDGAVWILAGILRAGGDTLFIFVVNAGCSWFLGTLPSYILIGLYGASASMQWVPSVGYAICNALLFWYRYKKGAWRTWQPADSA